MFKIGPSEISQGGRPFIIAEIGQAHDGSLGLAHAYIDLAARCGADAVKFQTHIASAESTKDEPFRVKFSKQDATRYDYWKRMEFTPEQWAGLSEHAKEKKIVFLSSAFSVEAVELLKQIGMGAWKIGSGEFRSMELMAVMAETGKPILLSTGMSRYEEIDAAVQWFQKKSLPFGLFQCTSMYPTALENVGLNVIGELNTTYNCPVGLSDHSGVVHPSIIAMSRGAAMIEVHITFDKGMFGPDVPASLTPEQLTLVCQSRDALVTMDSHPVNKDDMANRMATMRDLFTKSIALAGNMSAGTVLEESMIVARKPGTGIPFIDKQKYIGRVLKNDVAADRLLRLEDLE
jgi:N,N'-diacetyllegionaminate synthase